MSVGYYSKKWDIYLPEGDDIRLKRYKINPSSILFKEKEYPLCTGCNRKFIEELGCLWCNGHKQ